MLFLTGVITMKRYFIGLVIFLWSVVLFSCKDDEAKTAPYLEIERRSFQYDNKVHVEEIPVSTNIPDWTVSADAGAMEWCLPDKRSTTSGNSIKLVLTENTGPDIRKATVTVKGGNLVVDISVTQLGETPAILLSQDSVTVSGKAITIGLEVTSNVPYTVESDSAWVVRLPSPRAMVTDSIFLGIEANGTNRKRTAAVCFTGSSGEGTVAIKKEFKIIQAGKDANVGDVEVEGDIKIVPSGGHDNQHQPGQGIEKTWDGKFLSDGSDPYHSPWGPPYGDPTRFPVELSYLFGDAASSPERIDYLIYYTRSGNGNFGEVEIWVSTEEQPMLMKYGEYDFHMQNAPSKVVFADGLLHPREIKFVVKSGAGGFASCDEMEFYARKTGGTLEEQLLAVFTDITCTAVRSGVQQKDLDALPGYFAGIARAMQTGTYKSEFRIHDYPPYSVPEDWAARLYTRKYGILDNATGIYARSGEEMIVLVGDMHGQNISLMSIPDGGTEGDSYFLTEGVNKFTVRNTGLLYVMYHTDLSSSRALPVRIHIPEGSGTVNGYFDLDEHRTDTKYAELLAEASYPYFTVKGQHIMMTFHTNRLKEYVPRAILPTIEMWDHVIEWQWSLMGIENERGRLWNNRLFASSFEGDGYMWATDYRTGFHENTLYKILVPETMMAEKDNMWGPAHEIGHCNQFAIDWPGCSESSNNLFSNYVIYKFGKFCSRGSALSELNTHRVVQDQPFTLIDGATHQGENTELHMRMNWQLFVYFHRVLGDEEFWPRLFRLLRQSPPVTGDPGKSQLNFVEQACDAARLDLTDFFEMWGFFVPVENVPFEQYGNWTLTVSEQMIADTKARIAAKGYPKPLHVIHYIEDRRQDDPGNTDVVGDVGYWTQFRDDQRITKTVSYTVLGSVVRIKDGEEAAAFELRDAGDKLIWFSNFLNFEVPASILERMNKIYAVQADGSRIVVVAEN